MAGTTFYLHAANSANHQTLPSTSKSSLTATINFQSQANNLSLNTTKGVSQTTLSDPTGSGSSVNTFIGKWVSDGYINQSSIASGTWTYGFGAQRASTSSDDFPCDNSTGTKTYVCVYVYRPSNSTVVGYILDGYTGTTYSDGYTGAVSQYGTFAGASVSSIVASDVLVFEAWQSQGRGQFGDLYYYDGTTQPSSTGSGFSSMAAFITSPSTISIQLPVLYSYSFAEQIPEPRTAIIIQA